MRRRFIAEVNSQHVRLLFHVFHQQISEGNLIAHIRKHHQYIGYYQCGDVPGRNDPGTGEINWRNVFKAIYETGYRIWWVWNTGSPWRERRDWKSVLKPTARPTTGSRHPPHGMAL